MVDHITDFDGKVIAYCEWSVTDNQGKLDDKGEYCFVRELWIWEGKRGKSQIIRSFIKQITESLPQLKYAYWKRPKHSSRVKTFTREALYGRE